MIGIYGASGFGREVIPLVAARAPNVRTVFIDDAIGEREDVMSYAQFRARGDVTGIVVAIADAEVRQRLVERVTADGITAIDVRAASAQVVGRGVIGDHAILCANVVLTTDFVIGRGFHANLNAYVAHDCVIGDFVTFAPNVACNGNVHIGDGAYIGTGAILRQGKPGQPLRIGAGAVVGMGAVVTRDVAPGETVVGNPARPLVR